MRTDKCPLGVDVEQVRAKLLAGVNFEHVHAELMAALDGIAAGKGHRDLFDVPRVGTTTKIFDAVQRAVQFLYEPFESKDIEVVDRVYAKLAKTRQFCARDPRSSNRQTLNLGGTCL